MGCSLAYHLARAGRRVVVIDRGNTPDFQPLIGPLQPGLWIAAGFSGHGFMMAPVIGRRLSSWMTDDAPIDDLRDYAPDRFAAGALQPERNVV
jgi:sarcosine oxidase, subunit beta